MMCKGKLVFPVFTSFLILTAFVGVSAAKTIYMPDDYEKILWTVDNATDEDTMLKRITVRDYGLANSAWPMFRHDEKHTAKSPYTIPDEPALKWAFNIGSPISSSPAIGEDGTIYVGANDGRLYAINPNGTLKWSFETGDKITSSPAVAKNGTIYVGSYDGYVYAINPNGSLKWKFKTISHIPTSPVIDSSGIIYIAAGYDESWHGEVYALYPNGTLKWKFRPPTSGSWIYTSPAIGKNGEIIFGDSTNPDGKLWALNPENGNVLWSVTLPSPYGENDITSVAIDENGVIYVGGVNANRHLWAVYPNGTIAWRYDTGGCPVLPPAIGNDVIYVSSTNKLFAINKDGTLKWSFEMDSDISSPVIDAKETVIVGCSDGKLYAINPNGSLKWNFSIDGAICSSPAIDKDGTIYVGSSDGKLYAISKGESKPTVKVIIGVENKDFMSDEVEKLKQYLKEMGINPQIFYTSDSFDWTNFKDCDLIIYHNMGWDWYDHKNGKSPKIYEILDKAKNTGIPILVLGDDLTWNANDYWVSEVLHLHSADSNGEGGKVEIINSSSPIINGKYGKVQNFTYIGDMDIICNYEEGSVLAVHKLGVRSKIANFTYPTPTTTPEPVKIKGLCSETPVVFYYINKSPVVVINLNLYIKDRNGNIVGEESDLEMIRILFKNSVDYLLNWSWKKEIYVCVPSCAPKFIQAFPGSNISFVLKVKNTGTEEDTVLLSVTDELGWDFEYPEKIELAPGEEKYFFLNFTPPYNVFNKICVEAVSESDPLKVSKCNVFYSPLLSGYPLSFAFSFNTTEELEVEEVSEFVKVSEFSPIDGNLILFIFVEPVGGRVKNIIKVKSKETGESVAIPFTTVNHTAITTDFKFPDDSYSFRNWGKLITIPILDWEFSIGGRCFGMSETCLLFYEGIYELPEGRHCLYEVQKDDKTTFYNIPVSIGTLITIHQIRFKNTLTDWLKEFAKTNNKAEYINLKQNILRNEPVILGMLGGKSSKGKEKVLHACVAYGIIEVGNKAYILMYDNNYPYKNDAFNFSLSHACAVLDKEKWSFRYSQYSKMMVVKATPLLKAELEQLLSEGNISTLPRRNISNITIQRSD